MDLPALPSAIYGFASAAVGHLLLFTSQEPLVKAVFALCLYVSSARAADRTSMRSTARSCIVYSLAPPYPQQEDLTGLSMAENAGQEGEGMEFDEEGEVCEEPELEGEDPGAEAAAASKDDEEVKSGRRGKKRKAEEGPSLCEICQEEARTGKTLYCTACRKHVAACRKDAERNDTMTVFEERSKRKDTFREMVLRFITESPGTRSGCTRQSMDWVKFIDEVFTVTQVVKGSKEAMMDWPDFEEHHKKKFAMSAATIAERWAEALLGLGADKNGEREGFIDRVPVSVQSYRLTETIAGNRRASVAGTKDVKNPTQEELQKHDGWTQKDAMNLDNAHFAKLLPDGPESPNQKGLFSVPSQSTRARPSPAGKGQAGAGPGRKKKDIGRSRVQQFEQLTAGTKGVATKLEEGLKFAEEKRDTFDGDEAEYKLYTAILEARIDTVTAVLDESEDSIEEHVAGLSAEVLRFLPIQDWGKVVKPHKLKGMVDEVLQIDTAEDLEAFRSNMDEKMGYLHQLATAVRGAADDLTKAKEARDKAAAKAAKQAEAKAAAKEKAAAKKAKREAAKAPKKGAAQSSGATAEAVDLWATLTEVNSGKAAEVADFFKKITPAEASADFKPKVSDLGAVGFFKWTAIDDAVKNSPPLLTQLSNFRDQYPMTKLAKTNGRVGAPVRSGEKMKMNKWQFEFFICSGPMKVQLVRKNNT